jgi:HD-like signal output (HDOD) protein
MISIDAIIKQIDYLPSFNQVAHKALGLLTQPNTNIKDIADVIRFDSGLTANIIKISNTAHYSPSREIAEIGMAIKYLGRDKMIQILTISSTSKYFRNISKGYEQIRGELWKHSISTGLIAEYLSYYEPQANKGTLFISGVMHDIGKTILSIWLADLWTDITHLVKNNNVEYLEAEKSVLGFTHSLVSSYILQKWEFPNDVIVAAKHHHERKNHNNPVARITKLADYISILMGYMTSEDNMLYGGYEDLMEFYKIQSNDLQVIMNECFEIIQKVIIAISNVD